MENKMEMFWDDSDVLADNQKEGHDYMVEMLEKRLGREATEEEIEEEQEAYMLVEGWYF